MALAQTDATQVGEEITVTGSRIQRLGFSAPTPTTVIGIDEIQARSAVTLSDLLYQLPDYRNAATPAVNTAGSGGNFVNLRGLNAGTTSRNLVLVDSQRFVPTSITGQIDTNVVPTSLVERIETVTGGASAAWGSDAVSGVTNIILKKKLEGFQGNIQYGVSQRHDSKSNSASLGWGSSFADGRGQVMLAGEYSKSYDPQLLGSRDWGLGQIGNFNAVTINGLSYNNVGIPGATIATLSNGGVVTGYSTSALTATTPVFTALYNSTTQAVSQNYFGANIANRTGVQYGAGGTRQTFQYGTSVAAISASNAPLMVGGDGAWFSNQLPLSTPLERKNLYASGSFELTDRIRASSQVSWTETHSRVTPFPSYNPNLDNDILISRNNAYAQQLGIFNGTPATVNWLYMGRINTEIGGPVYDTTNTVKRVSASLDGEFGATGKWSVYATHGETTYDQNIRNTLNEGRYRAGLSAINSGGRIICDPVAAARYQVDAATCVPGNPFGQGSFSPEFVQYVTGTSNYHYVYGQNAAGTSIRGEPITNWVGPVSAVAGLEWRRESAVATADPDAYKATPDFANGQWQFGNNSPFSGAYNVREFFAETVMPLLPKQLGIESLDLDTAIRRTDYSTSGYVTTWKAGITWSPVAGLLFRGTRSRDIRAPNLNENFLGARVTQSNVNDYITGAQQAVSVQVVNTGNTALLPEKADTLTLGVTWTPASVRGLDLSLDWYQIELDNAINQIGAQNLISSCLQPLAPTLLSTFLYVPANCASIVRNSGNQITTVYNQYVNVGQIYNFGWDAEVAYRFSLAKVWSGLGGNLNLRALLNYVPTQQTKNGYTVAGTTEAAGLAANPKARLSLTADYDNGPLRVSRQGRYIQSALVATYVNEVSRLNNRIPPYFYLNASAQYVLWDKKGRGRVTVYGNINNLFDKDPPVLAGGNGTTGNPATVSAYDQVGRAFVAGLRFSY